MPPARQPFYRQPARKRLLWQDVRLPRGPLQSRADSGGKGTCLVSGATATGGPVKDRRLARRLRRGSDRRTVLIAFVELHFDPSTRKASSVPASRFTTPAREDVQVQVRGRR